MNAPVFDVGDRVVVLATYAGKIAIGDRVTVIDVRSFLTVESDRGVRGHYMTYQVEAVPAVDLLGDLVR